MNERTIQRLKHKFIVTAMLSFAAVMLFMAAAIYLTNLAMSRSEIREVMAYIISNDGYLTDSSEDEDTSGEEDDTADTADTDEEDETEDAAESAASTEAESTEEESASATAGTQTPDAEAATSAGTQTPDAGAADSADTQAPDAGAADSADTQTTAAAIAATQESTFQAVTTPIEKPGRGIRNNFRDQLQNLFGVGSNYDSPEFFYATRYFAVVYGQQGNVSNVITQHIAAIDREQAVEYANQVRRSWVRFGSFGDYYYQVSEEDDGSAIVVFLDCTSSLAVSRRIMYVSLILIGFGMLLSWIVLRSVSNRVVQPEIRNSEMQKSFITNASHELKTPLAVIRANTELQEMLTGENEWTQSTLRQVDRMQGLIQNLVMISRAQEQDNKVARTSIDVSKAVTETVKTFAPVASQDGKELIPKIQEGLMMEAEEGQIRQLTSVLVDNAIKYCDEKGTITVLLEKKGRSNIRLAVSNNYAAGKNEDYHRFFDRFYRADQSHNQDKGGYGIGLSIAQNLVEQYHGTISASWADGVITFTCVL